MVPSIKEYHFAGPRKHACCVAIPALWNDLTSKINVIPPPVLLKKLLKTWLFSPGLENRVNMEPGLDCFGYFTLLIGVFLYVGCFYRHLGIFIGKTVYELAAHSQCFRQ